MMTGDRNGHAMWVKIEAERLLRVAFGRDIILCENGGSPTVVLVRLSRPALLALQVELEKACGNSSAKAGSGLSSTNLRQPGERT